MVLDVLRGLNSIKRLAALNQNGKDKYVHQMYRDMFANSLNLNEDFNRVAQQTMREVIDLYLKNKNPESRNDDLRRLYDADVAFLGVLNLLSLNGRAMKKYYENGSLSGMRANDIVPSLRLAHEKYQGKTPYEILHEDNRLGMFDIGLIHNDIDSHTEALRNGRNVSSVKHKIDTFSPIPENIAWPNGNKTKKDDASADSAPDAAVGCAVSAGQIAVAVAGKKTEQR